VNTVADNLSRDVVKLKKLPKSVVFQKREEINFNNEIKQLTKVIRNATNIQ
jgi:hypothetical protein